MNRLVYTVKCVKKTGPYRVILPEIKSVYQDCMFCMTVKKAHDGKLQIQQCFDVIVLLM